MKNNEKVLARALTQFVYINDRNHYEFVQENREFFVHYKEAIRLSNLDVIDVLNPYLNEDSLVKQTMEGFAKFEEEGVVIWP